MERFEDFLSDPENSRWFLSQCIAILEDPKGLSLTVWLVDNDGVLYVRRVKSGRHIIPGPNCF
jgi:hypothetical protein